MKPLLVAPIVEGHGEVEAVRILLTRLGTELWNADIQVLPPIRQPRTRLVKQEELSRAVQLAALKLQSRESSAPRLILLLLDADKDPVCKLAPRLLEWAREARADFDIACVLANLEYETWFVAAASSLTQDLDLSDRSLPEDPEAARSGKAWIQRSFRGPSYSETVDQPAMTAKMDLRLCRRRSPSFDKLCRELEKRLEAS